MASLIRGKQAGIQKDLSAGLTAERFILDDVSSLWKMHRLKAGYGDFYDWWVARYGINSRISCMAYEPVQSLLAVGTSETQYGAGQIYIFGRNRVSGVYTLNRKASVTILQFCLDKLIIASSKNEISIFSLTERKIDVTYSPPGHVTTILTDPGLDFALIGLQSGEVVTYDMDRHMLAPLRIPNVWRERSNAPRYVPIVSLAFQPRDIGTLLIGYQEGAVVFSLKANAPMQFLQYEIPRGAPGGDGSPISAASVRLPKLTNAIWHPTGTFILTVHDDNSLVFWDPKEARVVMARTLTNIDVDKPDAPVNGDQSPKDLITKVAWCCKENPDDTGILIAGGHRSTGDKYLTFWDLGPTPVYATSSWKALSGHFASPRSERKLPTPPSATVSNFCLIPRRSPWFYNCQDPIAVINLLSSGEAVTLSLPSGYAISPTNMLHISLSFVHPFATNLALSYVDRGRWIGWREKRNMGPQILKGGSEAHRPMKRFEFRDIVQVAHADGIIRLWDAGHDDHIENPSVLQIDLATALGRGTDLDVTEMSLSGPAGEFAVGLKSGEIVVFKWGPNVHYGEPSPSNGSNGGPNNVITISQRADPGLKEGFVPFCLLDQKQGAVTALKQSDVGFVAVGYASGSIAVIDLRAPKVIYSAHINNFTKQRHSSLSLKRRSASGNNVADYVTSIEFGIMTVESDEYSSINLFVGTSRGHVATFKLLPSGSGYEVTPVGSVSLNSKVIYLYPLNADTGRGAGATQPAYAGLRNGERVNGVLVAVTPSSVRIFKPATSRGAHKDWDDYLCDSAAVVTVDDRARSLVGIFGDGNVRAFAIPSLREIGCNKIGHILEPRRLGEARVTSATDVVGWVGPSEIALIDLYGGGVPIRRMDDTLFNPMAQYPFRPVISNFQWISGTQYITPSDLSMLIGGPDRPPSKKMIEQMRLEEQEAREAKKAANKASTGRVDPSGQRTEESYWQYMQRQMQERTEKLGFTEDSMDRLEESSSGFMDDVNKFVKDQKKKAVLGAFGSKFGF
ncbi:hypothetical protein KEM54_006580 [Ascosphaera aggregata]|nr:hypothetical protein KEM54_006580 [Ascosphaera aggregata]